MNIKGVVTFLEITEAFYTQIQITLYLGIFFTIPVFWLQTYMFFCPGIFKKEQNLFIYLLIGSWILIFVSFFSTINFLLPQAWKFFLGFGTITSPGPEDLAGPEGTGSTLIFSNLWNFMPSLKNYLNLIFDFLFCILVSSQLPVAFFLFIIWYKETNNLENLLNFLVKGRSWVIVFLLSWAAVLTPPDLWSQILFFIPSFFIYELVIYIFYIISYVDGQQSSQHLS